MSPQFSNGFPATEDNVRQNAPREIHMPVINQVNFASTISALMDIAVPENNVGTPIFPVVTHLMNSSAAVLSAVCKLANQLKQTLPQGSVRDRLTGTQKDYCQLNEIDAEMKDAEIKDAKVLLEVCREAAETLSSAPSDYGIVNMSLALILLAFLVTLQVIILLRFSTFVVSQRHCGVFVFAAFHAIFCGSSFVKEEHQLWYCWIPLSYAVLLARLRKSDLNYASYVGRLGVLFVLHRVLPS